MNAHQRKIFEFCQESCNFFPFVDIAVPIAEILNALFLILLTNRVDAELFRPVERINHERTAGRSAVPDKFDFIFEHLP